MRLIPLRELRKRRPLSAPETWHWRDRSVQPLEPGRSAFCKLDAVYSPGAR